MKGLTPTSSRRRRSRSASSFSALSCVMSALSTAILPVPLHRINLPLVMGVDLSLNAVELRGVLPDPVLDVLTVHLELLTGHEVVVDLIPNRRLLLFQGRERIFGEESEDRDKTHDDVLDEGGRAHAAISDA